MRRHFMGVMLALAITVGPVGTGAASGAASGAARVSHESNRDSALVSKVTSYNHLSTGGHTVLVSVGGRQRTFIVEVPAGKPVVNRALVLVFHGAEDTASGTIATTNLLQQVTARGDVIAFLQGYQDTWNEGSGSTPASLAHVNDVAYTAAVIARLRSLVSFASSRIAAVGFSNGAIMVEDLGCQLSSLISLFVPVEGQMSTVQSASCRLVRPVSVYEIHATSDPTIPYNGGYFATAIGEDTVLSAPQSVARWAHLDGCSTGPVTTTSSGISVATYGKCRSGASVRLRTIFGGQHAWPTNIGQLVVQQLSRFPL